MFDLFNREHDDTRPHPSVYVHKPGLPPVVTAAFTFIQLSGHGQGNGMMDAGDTPKAARKKSDGELRTLESAFMVIHHYLTGEMKYDDTPKVIELPAPKKATYAYSYEPTDQKPAHPLAKVSG